MLHARRALRPLRSLAVCMHEVGATTGAGRRARAGMARVRRGERTIGIPAAGPRGHHRLVGELRRRQSAHRTVEEAGHGESHPTSHLEARRRRAAPAGTLPVARAPGRVRITSSKSGPRRSSRASCRSSRSSCASRTRYSGSPARRDSGQKRRNRGGGRTRATPQRSSARE